MAPNASEIGPPNIPAKFVGPAPATGAAPAAAAPSDTSPSICVREKSPSFSSMAPTVMDPSPAPPNSEMI